MGSLGLRVVSIWAIVELFKICFSEDLLTARRNYVYEIQSFKTKVVEIIQFFCYFSEKKPGTVFLGKLKALMNKMNSILVFECPCLNKFCR